MSISVTLSVGQTYRIKLTNGFNSLGYLAESESPDTTGVYRLVRIMSYDELVQTSTSLLNDTYKAANKDTSTIKADLAGLYLNKKFYIFESIYDETVRYCFCEEDLDGDPIYGLQKYAKYGLIIDAATWPNDSVLQVSAKYIRDDLIQRFGIALGQDGVTVVEYMTTYLTDAEYAAVVANRAAIKSAQPNYFAQMEVLEKTNAALAAENDALREQVLALQALLAQ